MKKVLLIIISLCLFLSLVGCGGTANSQGGVGDGNQKAPFNFIFKYSVTARNVLDTFQGTFTKDMVLDPPITIELTLSDAEMDSIYQKMVEIDFFSYPNEFEVDVSGSELIGTVTPYSTYYFDVEYPSGTKELKWEDEITNPDEKADKLRELINLIRNIVESKEEYKNLPEPGSGYL